MWIHFEMKDRAGRCPCALSRKKPAPSARLGRYRYRENFFFFLNYNNVTFTQSKKGRNKSQGRLRSVSDILRYKRAQVTWRLSSLCCSNRRGGFLYSASIQYDVFWAAETRLEEKKSQENACPKFVLQLLVRHHNELVSSFITFGRLLLAHFTDFRPTWVHLVPHWKAIPSSSHCPSVFLLFSFCPVSFVACVRLEEKKDEIKNGRKKNE